MAQPIILNDMVLVKVWSVDSEQASVQRVWYQCTNVVGTGGTDQQATDVFDTPLNTDYKAILNNNAQYRGIQVQIYRAGEPLASVFENANAGVGTGGSIALPRQVSGIITTKTLFAGRRFRGRSYLPFPSTTADQGNGIPTAGYIAATQLVANVLFNAHTVGTGGNTSTIIPVLVHAAGKTPTPPVTPIVDADSVAKWATQRRRGSYGRANSSPI